MQIVWDFPNEVHLATYGERITCPGCQKVHRFERGFLWTWFHTGGKDHGRQKYISTCSQLCFLMEVSAAALNEA